MGAPVPAAGRGAQPFVAGPEGKTPHEIWIYDLSVAPAPAARNLEWRRPTAFLQTLRAAPLILEGEMKTSEVPAPRVLPPLTKTSKRARRARVQHLDEQPYEAERLAEFTAAMTHARQIARELKWRATACPVLESHLTVVRHLCTAATIVGFEYTLAERTGAEIAGCSRETWKKYNKKWERADRFYERIGTAPDGTARWRIIGPQEEFSPASSHHSASAATAPEEPSSTAPAGAAEAGLNSSSRLPTLTRVQYDIWYGRLATKRIYDALSWTEARSAKAIATFYGITPRAVNHQLRWLLRKAGLVTQHRRDGKTTWIKRQSRPARDDREFGEPEIKTRAGRNLRRSYLLRAAERVDVVGAGHRAARRHQKEREAYRARFQRTTKPAVDWAAMKRRGLAMVQGRIESAEAAR